MQSRKAGNMNQMTTALLMTLQWMTEHFSQIEIDMGRPPEAFSPELKAALAQKEMLEQKMIKVVDN